MRLAEKFVQRQVYLLVKDAGVVRFGPRKWSSRYANQTLTRVRRVGLLYHTRSQDNVNST